MSFENVQSYISFSYGITMGRIYKLKNEYVVMSVDNLFISPFGDKSMIKTAEYIIKLFEKSDYDIDYKINYNHKISKKRKNRVLKLCEDKTLTKKFIIASLTYI